MQPYRYGDPYEIEPLDSSHEQYAAPPGPPAPPPHGYTQPAPSYQSAPPRRRPEPSYSQRFQGHDPSYSRARSNSPYEHGVPNQGSTVPRRQAEDTHYAGAGSSRPRGGEMGYAHPAASSTITPGSDNFSEAASGGMAGIAYNVAERNARESGLEAMRGTGQLPPPPSRRNDYQNVPQHTLTPQPSGKLRAYDPGYGAGAGPSGASPARSLASLRSDQYSDDPYQGYARATGNVNPGLGMVNPNDIEDDGDDGLHYGKSSQRNSIMSSSNSEQGPRPGRGATAAAGGAAAGGGVLRGVLRRKDHQNPTSDYYAPAGPEKPSEWLSKRKGHSKRWKWTIIGLLFFVIAGATIGGIVGGLVTSKDNHGRKGKNSAAEDEKKNGDLGLQSSEIQDLLNNKDLHKVFPGMDYTPFNTQYPDCVGDPPSQNNVTRDVAVLSQLTNKIRLYGTDCNQTQMVLHAIDMLEMKDDIKVWLGVWQDNNGTTNARQLQQMWSILDDYGAAPFEGIIVANEVLFRKDMTINQLGTVLDNVRTKLTAKNLDLKVATSDLGDDWTAALAEDSELIMANIHPFFSGVQASDAAAWTMNFWETKDDQFFKTTKSLNIISETGWPSAGGTDCGGAATCAAGSVAGITEMNRYLDDFVCQALDNGTNYFWFEAFDEPWKVVYNTPGEKWEDKWGLMDAGRNLKDGIVIPSCGGKTVS